MIDPVTLHRLSFATLFTLLAALVVFLRVLPLSSTPGGMPPPDMIVLLGFAWVLRRPDFVPVTLFAALLLIADFLFLRPPGVATGFAVIGLEALRARAGLMREQSFLAEWFAVSAVLVLMLLGERLVLALFLVGQASFGLSVYGLVVDVAVYPLVVGASILLFRVRRLAPGEHAAEARLV